MLRRTLQINKNRDLLPNAREFICNSEDRVTNFPAKNKVPERLNLNSAKTANLQVDLKLKVDAPILITTNHAKQKYRED